MRGPFSATYRSHKGQTLTLKTAGCSRVSAQISITTATITLRKHFKYQASGAAWWVWLTIGAPADRVWNAYYRKTFSQKPKIAAALKA